MTELIDSVVQGFPIGCVYALVAIGLVLTYKVSGVFNLAFGAQAYASAVVFHELRGEREWSIPAAVAVAVFVAAPLLGLALYWGLFRSLRGASPIARLVVALGLMLALPQIVNVVFDVGASPIYRPSGITADGDLVYYRFGDYAVSRDELAAIIITLVALVVLTVVFRYTAIGLRMRAVVESPRMTELVGVSSDRVSSAGWILSSLFAGLAGVMLAPLFAQLDESFFFNLAITAIAAAAFAGLTSLPLALVGGVGLAVIAQILARYLPTGSIIAQGLRPSLPFVALFLVLILRPSMQRRAVTADPLAGVEPPPPALAADTRGPLLTRITWVAAGAFATWFVWNVTVIGDAVTLTQGTKTVIFAVIFLSFTVFTGMAGQISLAQGAFAAIGAFATGQLATNLDWPVVVTLFIGVAVASAVGVVIAVPALRLGGIYLALATLGFALFFENVISPQAWASGGQVAIEAPRPQLGPLDLANDRAFFFFCLLVLLGAAFFVTRLRTGTTGSFLRALRGSEVAAASVGINPARSRITAFAVSSGLAGLGGGLLAMQAGRAQYDGSFNVQLGLLWVVTVAVIGSRTVDGAILAAFALIFVPELLSRYDLADAWQGIVFGLGTALFARHPEGAVEYYKRRALNAIQARLDRRESHGDVVASSPAGRASGVHEAGSATAERTD